MLLGVIVLHLAVYYVVTRINGGRPTEAFHDPSIGLDDAIPLLGWTWPLYWAAYPYLTAGAALIVGGMRQAEYRCAIRAFVAITLIGGTVQLAYPVAAPWTTDTHAMQMAMHTSAWTLPYACLPSMHVAYSVLTAMLGAAAGPPVWRWSHIGLAFLITLSTLTLKEHYVADAAAGLALGVAGGFWWLRRRPASAVVHR